MLSSPSPLQLVLIGVLLSLLLPWVCLHLIALPQAWPKTSSRRRMPASLWMLLRLPLCASLLLLSGCGTPRSPVFVSLPEIPAELMQGPLSPVLLGVPSPSMTPGRIKPRTPSGAASTAAGTSN